jgi:hypothetical protein
VKHLVYIILIFALQSSLVAGNSDKTKAAAKHVSGKITSVNGEEIAGAKITIKETNESFYSDLDGSFKLQVKTDKVYSISIQTIGYAPLEVKSTDLHLISEVLLKELH